MTPTILHVGAIRDHQAGYFRRAFRSQASDNYRYLTRAGCGNRAIEVITFRAKTARGQLALAPVGPALTLQRRGTQIKPTTPAILSRKRGVGHRHERWDGLRWTRQRRARAWSQGGYP